MLVKNYYDLSSKEKESFFMFLDAASKETDQPAHQNMYSPDWNNKPETLLYLLEKTDRFKNGFFSILFDNNIIAACSGAYKSDFCNEVAILGCRTWIASSYRNQLISREYLLPHEKSWAISAGCKILAVTFNDYNKKLIHIWQRARFGEKRPDRKKHHFGYENLNTLDFPVLIQYTKQYVLYEQIDSTFNFDWKSIEYKI